jgi:ABC-2 type transport system ATP-binding protein
MRLLLDFIRPTSGSAQIFGLDVRRSAVEIHRRIGYVPADIELYERLTASETFEWLGRLRPYGDKAYLADLIDRLALDPSRIIENLSTGNRQKVAVIQALMHQPELLILDEPTSGLDPLVRREFRELIHEAKARGATVFLSSHELAEVEDICDRVGIIVNGRLRSIETVVDLRNSLRRHVRISFAEGTSLGDFSRVDGVTNYLATPPGADSGPVVELDIAGSLAGLIRELAKYQVVDLLSEPLSLSQYFLESYDVENLGAQLLGGVELKEATDVG